MLSALTVLIASEQGHEGISPILVGVLVLIVLLAMLGAVVAFGGGREHS